MRGQELEILARDFVDYYIVLSSIREGVSREINLTGTNQEVLDRVSEEMKRYLQHDRKRGDLTIGIGTGTERNGHCYTINVDWFTSKGLKGNLSIGMI